MLKIVFMGTPAFGVPILEALIQKYEVIGVVTQPDKRVGRKQEIVMSPVKICALEHHIPVFQPEKIRKDYDEIMALAPDLIVTAAYGQLVGMKLLNSPKYRSINVHASLLPLYRGGAPIHQAIKDGQKKTGVTIMYMEKEMDAGDILAQREIDILDEDNCGTMFEKLSYLGRDLLLETIERLCHHTITPIAQNAALATFAYNITKEEEQLDFTQDAKRVFDHIRAYNPNPIAYMLIKGEPLKIYESRVIDEKHQLAPGTIYVKEKNRVFVACGEQTVLELLVVQPVGKKVMQAKDFANGALRKYL
ncbi:MAG: methionyl-tRNA formyltransferase [Prevotella sp.]|nr:methionyl-tRNA formyltransferase [Staphylococcus sp.]MCM1350498.1 methionyl-tRNA formyltransferase [Prevotella sp.]